LTRIALTIAGSDSSGGAGIQADLKTFQAFGVFGTSVIVALTAQNTQGVRGVHTVPGDFVRLQFDAVVSDLRPHACKSGMLGTAALVATVADCLESASLPNYVLDPVLVATSGDRLLDADAERALMQRLVPLAALVTPNLDEAEVLIGKEVRTVEAMRAAARMLVGAGARAALVKGGHLEGDDVVDVLFDGTEMREWRRRKQRTTSTHGTGCTLSAAIAAGLARGGSLVRAVEDALEYVSAAIANAPRIGAGHGPLQHGLPGSASPQKE
jgi:hydroxymethylpyrimidine kinase/phosphomethylpyrimidine kinase